MLGQNVARVQWIQHYTSKEREEAEVELHTHYYISYYTEEAVPLHNTPL
jgi:hypothetical protein